MKKRIFTLLVLALSLLAFSSCAVTEPDQGSSQPERLNVKISAVTMSVKAGAPINITEIFTITVDGKNVPVTASMINKGDLDTVSPKAGTYTIVLTYTAKDGNVYSKQAKLTVESGLAETVRISHDDIKISDNDNFDPKTLFSLTVGGKAVEITDDMLELGNFDPENLTEGEYKINLAYTTSDGKTHRASATVTVVRAVIVSITATNARIKEGDTDFDLKTMFSLTADGESVTVTEAMIDSGDFNPSVAAPGEYKIKLTYKASDGMEHTATANLMVIAVWIGPF